MLALTPGIADMKAEAVILSKRNRKVLIPHNTTSTTQQPDQALLWPPQVFFPQICNAPRPPHRPLDRLRRPPAAMIWLR